MQYGGGDFHHVAAGSFGYFGEGGDSVGDDGGVGVGDEVVEGFDEAAFLDEVGGDVVEFGDADGGCFSNVLMIVFG